MANKQLVIEIISDAKKFTSGLTEAINTISKATKNAEGFEKYTEQLNEMKETLSQVSQNISQFEKKTQSGGQVSQVQLDSLASKIESINKRFDSFRHTFGDMQNKLNGLSTRTLQEQLNKANASLDAFNQKYISLQQTLNAGLGAKLNNYKDISQISNIGEMKAAYEDALKIFKNFSKEMQKDGNNNYSKSYTDAAAAVYKYADALISLNNIYHDNNKKNYYSENEFDKIQDMAFAAEDIIGDKLAQNISDKIQLSLNNIDIKKYFEEVVGEVDNQTLTGALKNGGVIIPVKLDSNAFSILENEIKKDISALQSRANANPVKVHYETDTEELSKNIEKYFKELNTKLKKQVAELNELMKNLVDNTGLKNTEQDFSSMAKLIPEMLRKVTEYSEQLKTITTDTKNSFENINSFTKEENFINYANAIKQTAESFKLLTSSLDDVSSKLSGNGLEGQFDILKKKFSELSIDTLTQEKTKENEQVRKTKIKEIKELFALYSTYQSRGGIRPFSDLISGDADANKKAYLQLAYNDYSKGKNKKGNGTESVPFDAKQLKDILQILKDIKKTIEGINQIKIDTSELGKIITQAQGNNTNSFFTPQAITQIWSVLIQYANSYSESLNKVIEKLEIISKKKFEPLAFDSEELKKTYNQINNIIKLLEKGFGIGSFDQLNSLFDNIEIKFNSLLNDKGVLDLRKNKEELKEIYDLYYKYLNLGGEKSLSSLTSNKKNQQKLDSGYKKYLNDLTSEEERTQEKSLKDAQISEQIKQTVINSINEIKNAVNSLREDLNLLAEIMVTIGSSSNNIDYTEKFDKIRQSVEDILDVEFSDNSVDYRERFDNIQNEVVILNEKVKNLNDTLSLLDFDKINNIKISTEPFDRIIESLKEIIDLTERISGVPSKSKLDSQFKDIQKIYSSLVNDKGNFITKDKDAVQNLFSQYSKYKNFGGLKTLTDLDDSKANVNKLSKYYNKYLDDISQQNESDISTTNSLKNEAQNFIGIKDAANEATVSKESFIKANKKLETQTDKTSKSLEQEKTQFETFINDVKTLVTTDIKSNNVVDFNTQILNSSKEVNEVLKEEIQQLQKLNEIQKNTPTNQNKKESKNNNSKPDNNSSKKQNNNKQTNTSKDFNGEFNYEDLGLSYDPYLNAFQEFLLLAADEAEKVKQQIISVAEFDQSLSDILTNLYAEIPDLEDISASTGYGKNFNVTGATVSYRDKTTNDIYKKTFSLRQDKDSGEFYIDQTTGILNNAEKYGKDNAKLQQQIEVWQTQLKAWIQSFNNKTSGTLKDTFDLKKLENFNFESKEDWIEIKTIQQRLEGLYNEIVSNSRRGTSSLSPVPNMMFNQESRLTKKQKAESIYNKMAVKWNGQDDNEKLENTEAELKELSRLYDVLQNEVVQFVEKGTNVESVAKAYGDFNEQLNKVNEQLNRIKIVNTEINGNKISNLNNWFKDIPNPEDAQGKIERYGQVYNQFAEAQQRLNELTTNLNKGTTEEDAQKYEEDKEKIHSIVLELEELKKLLSSDSMNIKNQMGEVIKQNIPEASDIKEIEKVINEYADARGKITDTSTTFDTDKEGNEFVTFSKIIQDTKGKITEFEFTYNKAMGTIAVATKKVQEPESAFKTLADELTTKWRGFFTTLASFTGFTQLWGYFKQGLNTIREFDAALTEMQKVSDETISTLQDYQKTTFDTADAIGATALQIQNSTADFMRLGESLKEAAESAKVANVLMNVSEFQSIDEATKSLIAMSAAYDDLSKMNIIDKLNEVGNNYAISTSEAATALQNSASALKTAGNDMDEALALITAGNAVVQDANKVGTGMRTIALRLTGTKSAKETLEDLGEETDSMLTTQSKLRDTIKEATAVASNGFKGFDILDDNGNYKSTYEIMLGIADVYNEILETDKQFGRNNANLLLESVAGKNRANIAASIFQNPQLLREAYKSSQEAENSAMEENEKYMNSINGHIAQLQNAYQQMWANSMNRDTINYFVDLGKSILQVVDNVGLLGTAFISITGVKSIVGYQNGKGFAYEIIKGSKNAIKALAQTDGAMGSLASTAVSAGQAIKRSFSAAIPIIGGVGTAIALVAIGINAFIQHQKQVRKELVDSARATGEEWQQQKQTLSEYSSQYEELKNKLDTGNLSEQETIEIKQKIYDIQKQITDQYGNTANKIDLINGELNEQLLLIDNISQAEADRIWYSDDYQKGFELAKKAMTTESEYGLSMALDFENYKTPEDKALSHIIQKYTQERSYGRDSGQIGTYRAIVGNPVEADERILKMMEEIEKLQEQNPYNKDLQKRAENVTSFLKQYRDDIGKIRQDNESAYLEGLPIELLATRAYKDYEVYSNYQSSVSNLESAYALGDSKKIRQARDDFEEATKAKEEFLKVPANNEFSILFDNIDTSVIDTKNRTEDATKAIKKSLQMGEDISRLESYKKQKQQADDFIKSNLDNLQQIGNIDNTNRPFIFWDTKEVKKQQKALESWGQSIEDVVGGYSTVFGGSGQFDGVDIAFTPIINDGTGKGKLLTKETLYNYINTLIANAGEGWTNDELFKLDAEGLIIDGQHISNVLGVVGNSMSEMGLTAEEVGEKMHDWQAESIGYVANFQDEWKKAIKQGKTFDEFMQDQEKDLKDITKATNKYSKEDKQLYQALKRVIDLDIDRVDAEQAFDASANGSQIYRNALENLMNALGYTIDDSGLMIDMLVANSIVHGDVADATNSASEAYNQFSQEIATAIENVSKLNTVLTESVSGAGISTQNIDAFKEMFGDDYVYALERSANGYHINAEKLQTLIDKQNALTNSDYQKTLDAQYDALKRCNDEIIKANNEQKDTSGLLAQRQGILQRIQDTQDLMMAYQASTSAFQTWTNAQSNGNEYDMYDKIANGYDTVKDLIDRGWSGDDTVRSYLDLIYGESFDAFTASGEECAEMFDNLDKKIEGTSFSIRDFFQFDSSGKITSNGIFNFFDALKEKQEQLGLSDDEKWIKDDGTYDFGFGRDRAAAEQLGIDVEFFQSMLRAAVSAGFELNLDQPMWAMDELEKKAIKAQEELGGFNDIDFKELYNNLDDEDAYETISGHIDDVYDYIQKIEDSDLSPELKTQQIEQAQDMLSYLVALEREAADKGDINLKATVVGSAKEELGKLIEETDELPEALKQYNWDEITDKDGLQKARNYIAAEIEGGRIDSSSAEAFLNILDQALDELNLIDEYEANPTLQGNTVGAFNDVKQARKELEKYIADAQQLETEYAEYDIKFNFSEDEKVKELLSIIYGEGTPEILASLGIDSGKTPEEIIEMLELGERDVDVLLKPDSSELEKSVQNSGKTVVTNTVSKQTNSVVNETKNLVTEYKEQVTNASMDTSDYDEGLEHVEKGNKEANKQKVEPKAEMDTKDFDKDASNTESKVKTLNSLSAAPSVVLSGASQVASAAESMRSQIAAIKGKTVSVVANFAYTGLSGMKSAIQSVLNKANELASSYTAHFANGTAHVRGTAFAKGSIVSNHAYAGGKWGLPDNQTALTGELGTEIVVRDGNWFTVGDDGAEFVNLKKGDINKIVSIYSDVYKINHLIAGNP